MPKVKSDFIGLKWERDPKGPLVANFGADTEYFTVFLSFTIDKVNDSYGRYGLYMNFADPMVFDTEKECKEAANEIYQKYMTDMFRFCKSRLRKD